MTIMMAIMNMVMTMMAIRRGSHFRRLRDNTKPQTERFE